MAIPAAEAAGRARFSQRSIKLATWNVNGIRARQAQVHEWIAQERPDVVCLQEIKATSDQVPAALCEMEGYWCYWHGGKGYSGVALHVSKAFAPERPAFAHPAFDYETRIATVECHRRSDGRVGLRAERRQGLPRQDAVSRGDGSYAAAFQAPAGAWSLLRRHERGPNRARRAPEGAEAARDRPTAGGARLIERILSRGLVDVGRALDPENDGLFTWWAPWRNMRQRNIGWRLDYVFASEALAARATACPVQKDVGTSDHAPVMATFA